MQSNFKPRWTQRSRRSLRGFGCSLVSFAKKIDKIAQKMLVGSFHNWKFHLCRWAADKQSTAGRQEDGNCSRIGLEEQRLCRTGYFTTSLGRGEENNLCWKQQYWMSIKLLIKFRASSCWPPFMVVILPSLYSCLQKRRSLRSCVATTPRSELRSRRWWQASTMSRSQWHNDNDGDMMMMMMMMMVIWWW